MKILPENGNSESILGLFSKLENGKLGFFFLGGDSTGSFLGLELLELRPNFAIIIFLFRVLSWQDRGARPLGAARQVPVRGST